MATFFIPFDPNARTTPERSDAARNRRRVLAAAERLFAERCVGDVTMDDVAREAGVGKGTLYRRFGDRAGLAVAVLDERGRDLQEAILRGPPPLGPGAPPTERLRAFLEALVDELEASLELLLVAETAATGARYRGRVYDAWRLHVTVLLRAARPDGELGILPDALLAPLAADLYRHLRRERGIDATEIKASLAALVAAVCEADVGRNAPGRR
jgi:AcrR family transcriptional regulator